MNVRQLIEELGKCSLDAEVELQVLGNDGFYVQPIGVVWPDNKRDPIVILESTASDQEGKR